MNVNAIGSAGAPANAPAMGTDPGKQTDPVSRDLQKQIEKLKNDLKEISANQDMPTDAKMKKRQEIQKQISDLEVQLRQHQIEARKEERQKKKDASSFDDLIGAKPQEKQNAKQNTGMSAGSMEAMISADVSVKQAGVNGSTAKRMEGKANVLEVEISLDSSRNGSSNIGLKEAELAKTKEAAEKATASQMDSLVQAGETLQEASKEEKTDRQKDDDEMKASDKKGKKEQEEGAADTLETPDEEALEETGYAYHPIDVRL